jgi:hypothetical protein
MFLASKAPEADAVNYAFTAGWFVVACSYLLLMWFLDGLRAWQKRWIPGGNVVMVLCCLVLIGLSAFLLH